MMLASNVRHLEIMWYTPRRLMDSVLITAARLQRTGRSASPFAFENLRSIELHPKWMDVGIDDARPFLGLPSVKIFTAAKVQTIRNYRRWAYYPRRDVNSKTSIEEISLLNIWIDQAYKFPVALSDLDNVHTIRLEYLGGDLCHVLEDIRRLKNRLSTLRLVQLQLPHTRCFWITSYTQRAFGRVLPMPTFADFDELKVLEVNDFFRHTGAGCTDHGPDDLGFRAVDLPPNIQPLTFLDVRHCFGELGHLLLDRAGIEAACRRLRTIHVAFCKPKSLHTTWPIREDSVPSDEWKKLVPIYRTSKIRLTFDMEVNVLGRREWVSGMRRTRDNESLVFKDIV